MMAREGIYARRTAYGERYFEVWSQGLPYEGGIAKRFRYLWTAELAYKRFKKRLRKNQVGKSG